MLSTKTLSEPGLNTIVMQNKALTSSCRILTNTPNRQQAEQTWENRLPMS